MLTSRLPEDQPGSHICPCCKGRGFMPSGNHCQFCDGTGQVEDAPLPSLSSDFDLPFGKNDPAAEIYARLTTITCDCFRIPHAFYCATVTRDLVPGYGQTAAGVADADDQRKADAR